ncbi:MAG: sensor histidine kinase [Desulfobulbus sp.]
MTVAPDTHAINDDARTERSPAGLETSRDYRRLWWQHYLLLLSIAILPLLLCSLVLHVMMPKSVPDGEDENTHRVLLGYAAQMQGALQSMHSATDQNSEQQLADLLTRLRAVSATYLSLELIDADGQPIASATSQESSSKTPAPTDRAWLETARQDGPAWSCAPSGADGAQLCQIVVPAANRSDASLLVATLDPFPMEQLLQTPWPGPAGSVQQGPDARAHSPLLYGLSAAALACILLGMGVYTTRTINQRRQSDRESDAHADMLLQANKMVALSKLAASVAHEVNNPLASIAERAGWMQDLLLEEDLAAHPNAAEFQSSVDKIEQHVNRARKIVQNLLGLTRRVDTDREPIDINRLLDETIGLLENEARYVNIDIEKKYAPNLPAVVSDLSQIQQIVLNLLNNAIDAIGRDGVVTVSTLDQPDHVEIKVADTGPGIPEEALKKIFEPFYTTKDPGKGTGLGLAISRGILEKLGGRLTVHSQPDVGTVFSMHLPKQQ